MKEEAIRSRSCTSSSGISRAAIRFCSARSPLDTDAKESLAPCWTKGREKDSPFSSLKGSASTERSFPLFDLDTVWAVEPERECDAVDASCALKKGLLKLFRLWLSSPNRSPLPTTSADWPPRWITSADCQW